VTAVRLAAVRPGPRLGAAPPGRFRRGLRVRVAGVALSLPVALFFAVFWLLPFLNALYLSFTDYAMAGSPSWIGLHNYRRLFGDADFWHSVRITVVFAVATVLPAIVFGLLISVPLSRPGRTRRWLRTALLVPAVIPIVAGSIAFVVLLSDHGLANTALGGIGLGHVDWLTDPHVALWSLIGMVLWKQLGLTVLILTAGLQGLPHDVFEAADLDGAGAVTTFFRITLPLLRRTVLFVSVMAVAAAMQSFIPAYLLTGGGPAQATEVLPLYLYSAAFTFQRMGYASAVAMVLLVALLMVSAVQFRLLGGERE
jgi:multiple sugar transport system permease protein